MSCAFRVSEHPLDDLDRRLIQATQAGLPITSRPFAVIAQELAINEEYVMKRMRRLRRIGVVRSIAAVPNHYALGYRHNIMTVWDIADDQTMDLGAKAGALSFVSHCYLRPRHLPLWPYNLFVMVHGRSEGEAENQIEQLTQLLIDACRAHARLLSTRILKKTGVRIGQENGAKPCSD